MPIDNQLADALSPETVTNTIVEQNMMLDTRGATIDSVLPLHVMGDSEEVYFRKDNTLLPLSRAGLTGEAPVGYMGDMAKEYRNVSTYRNKVNPAEQGANFELNTGPQLLDLYDWAGNYLERRMRLRREVTGWRGDADVDGFVGEEGDDAHADIPTDHVITSSAEYSDGTNSDPHGDFRAAAEVVDIDGVRLEEMGTPGAYMSPGTLYDLVEHPDLEDRFSGVNVQNLTEETLTQVLPIPNIEVVYTKTTRTNANGEPVDSSGNVVEDPENAAKDNVLEPYDAGAGETKRNIVFGAPGDISGVMPVLTDRLSEVMEAVPNMPGEFSVDDTLGFTVHQWADPNEKAAWFEIGQECGVELHAGENWAVIQDI